MARKGITEFDLDAPSLSKGERSEFRYQTRSLTSLIEQHLVGKYKHGKAWKVLVEVVPSITFPEHRDLLGALTVQVRGIPSDLLARQSDSAKCEMSLLWLTQGVRQLSEEIGLDAAEFESAAATVRSTEFRNVRQWVKPRRSPDGMHAADIVVEHKVHEALIIGRVFDRHGVEVTRQLLATELPDEFSFSARIGELTWLDDQRIQLSSRTGLDPLTFDLLP